MDQTVQSVYIPDPDEKIVYKNVRKPNLPSTADVAYCEIRIAELMAELEAEKEHSFKLQEQLDLYVTYEQSLIQYESKNAILSDENKQLSQSLNVKARDLEQAQFKILDLEQQIERLQAVDAELTRSIQLLTFKDRQIKELNDKSNQYEQILQGSKNWELINQDLKNQIINWKHDVELWKDRFTKSENERKRLLEIREENIKVDVLENIDTQPHSPQNELVEQQPVQKKSSTETTNLLQEVQVNLFEKEHQNGILNSELNKLRQQQLAFQKQISDLTGQLSKLEEKEKEISRLNDLLQEKPKVKIVVEERIVTVENEAIDEEKVRLAALLDDVNIQLEKSFEDIEQLKQQIQTQVTVIQQLQRDIRSIPKLQEQIELLTLDNGNLKNLLKSSQADNSQTLSLLKAKTIEVQNLQAVEVELQLANEKISSQQKEINDLRKQVGEVVQLEQTLNKSQTQLQEKQKVIEDLQKYISELQNVKVQLQGSLNDAQIQVGLLSRLEPRVKSQQSSIASLRQELQETLTESEQWREKYNQNCSELNRLQRLYEVSQQRLQKLNEENKNFITNFEVAPLRVEAVPAIKRIEKVVVEDSSKQGQIQNQLNQTQLQVESLLRNKQFDKQENQRKYDNLNSRYQQQRAESEQWKNKYIQSEQQNTHLLNATDKLTQSQQKCQGLQIVIEGLEHKVLQQGHEIEDLRTKVFTQALELNQIENYKIEKEQQKERALSLYSELMASQSRVARLLGSINDLQRQLALKQGVNQPQQIERSDVVEKLRAKITELEMEQDDTKDDQIDELNARIKVLESELKKQIDSNGQLIKELQNLDRKRQDVLSELQSLQTSESDSNQLRLAHYKKVKECDQLKIELDRQTLIIQDLAQQIEKLKESDADQLNQIIRLKNLNNNSNKQIASLLQHLNSLELTINTQRHKLDAYPEFEQRINDQINEINSLTAQNKETTVQRDQLSAQVSQLELTVAALKPLEQQVDLLRDTINNNQREINLWQTRFQDLENERAQQNEEWRRKVDQYLIELREQQELLNQIKQLQDNIDSLVQNNDKLVQHIKELEIQLEKQNRDIDTKDIEIKRLQAVENDFRKLQESYLQEIQKSQDLNDKLFELQNKYDQTRREQEKLENKCAMMSSEIERLKQMQNRKIQQLEEAKQQIHQQEQQIDQIQPVLVENKRLFEELQKSLIQSEELRIQIIALQKQLDESKRSIALEKDNHDELQSEIDRLLATLRGKEDDIHELRQVSRQFEVQIKDNRREEQQWNEQQNEMNRLGQLVNYLNETIDAKNVELENQAKQNNQLQLQLLENQKLDFQIMEKTLEAREKEVEDWRRRFQKLTQDQEKLYKEQLEAQNKHALQELEIERWKRKVGSHDSELQLQKNIIEQLNVELERLNESSLDLLADNEGWRDKYCKLQKQIPGMLEIVPPITPGSSFRVSEK